MLLNPSLDRQAFADAEPVPSVLPAARRRRRLIVALLWSAAVLLLVLAALSAGVAYVISRSVPLPFLSGTVAGMVEDALGPGYVATVGDTTLGTDPVLGLVLRVAGISVADGNGAEVLRVPSTMLELEIGAIIGPNSIIKSVEVDGLWAALRRDGNRIIVGNAATPVVPLPETTNATTAVAAVAPPRIAIPPADPVAAIVGPSSGFAMLTEPVEALDQSLADVLGFADRSGFAAIGIYGADIELWRAGGAEPQHFRRTDVRFEARPEEGTLTASLSSSGYSGRWTVTAERTLNAGNGDRTLSISFAQLTLADLFGPGTVTTDIPFYGRGAIRLSAEGEIVAAGATLDLGSGTFAFGPLADPIHLDEGYIFLDWDLERDTIFVNRAVLDFGPSYSVFQGWVRPDEAPGATGFAFDLESRDTLLAPRDSNAPPLQVGRIRFAGSVDMDGGLIHVDRASIMTERGSVTAAGSIGLETGGPSVAFAATFSEMPVDTLKQIWPVGLQDGGRRWLLAQMTDGTIRGGSLTAEIPAGALSGRIPLTRDMVRLEIELADVSFRTFDGMPDVVNADGVAVLAGNAFGADLTYGELVAPNGDVVRLNGAAFAIDETATRVPVAHVEVEAAGLTRAFGAIADTDPINALKQFGMPPEALEGTGTARMSATWPLVEGMTMAEVQWFIDLDLEGLTTAQPLEGRMIRDGNVNLAITPTLVTVTGRATVDDVPADVDFAFPLVPEVNGRQQLRMVLDEDARARLGFNLEGFLGGTVLADVRDLAPVEIGQHFDLDLTQTRVSLAPLGWTKGVGVPASMSFDLVQTGDGGFHLRDLELTGNGFGLVGEAFLDPSYVIQRVVINDFALRRDDQMSLEMVREGQGYAVTATGASVDIRGLIAEGLNSSIDTLAASGGGAPTDFRFVGDFDQLIGFNGEVIENAHIEFASVGGAIRLVQISGTLDGQPISGVYQEPAGVAGLDVYIGDAGRFLSFMNVYDKAYGGVLRVTGQEYGDQSIRGQLAISNFVIAGEQALTDLMVPPPGTPGAVPGTVSFDGLTFDFALMESRLTIEDALLRGGDMGAIGTGWVDLGAGSFNLTGTYIPAYEFNNLFGRIPILGLALGGGAREGLFGLTFRISGPFDNAQMEINPLSAIAPGIFRKIFEFIPEE